MNWTSAGAIALLFIGSAMSAETLRAEIEAPGDAAAPDGFSTEETWARVAPEMGRHLPRKVDDNTTWLTVANYGPVLISTFRKNLPKDAIVAAKREMERSAIQNTCRGTQRGKELLDAGGIVRQVFYDRDDQLAVTIDVDSKSCQQQ